jgi:hypothetical protein
MSEVPGGLRFAFRDLGWMTHQRVCRLKPALRFALGEGDRGHRPRLQIGARAGGLAG